jgi:hypothetical protein
MSICALINSVVKDPHEWCHDDLQSIMLEGDYLYGEATRKKNVNVLLPSELPLVVCSHTIPFTVRYGTSLCGNIEATDNDGPFLSLQHALQPLSKTGYHKALMTIGKCSDVGSTPAYT